MNAYCTPPEWNTPEIKKLIKKFIRENYGTRYEPFENDFFVKVEYKRGISTIGIPWITVFVPATPILPNINIASVTFEMFTNHCGIRSISHPSVIDQSLSELWSKTIEAFAHYCEYSLLLASDYTYSPATSTLLKQSNRGWVEIHPGVNRRMGPNHGISLFYKYLNNDNHDWIDWTYKGLTITRPAA